MQTRVQAGEKEVMVNVCGVWRGREKDGGRGGSFGGGAPLGVTGRRQTEQDCWRHFPRTLFLGGQSWDAFAVMVTRWAPQGRMASHAG